MKKRIALAAAIALAISVGGMLPAMAAKPAAPGDYNADTCARAGSTLEIREDTENVTVESDGTTLTFTFSDGTNPCTTGSVSTAIAGLTSVVIKGEGDLTFELEKGGNADPGTDVFPSWGSIVFTASVDGTLKFDGSLMDALLRPVVGTVTEESFTFGGLTGNYYAGTELSFLGGTAGDTLDASAVTTTAVVANGGDGDDTLKGGALDDDLTGGSGTTDGDDVLYGNGGDDMLDTDDNGECTDTLPNGNPHPQGHERCENTASGNDQAWGGDGDDIITSDGGDVVAPGDGADEITGPAFQLYYGDSGAAIEINLTTAAGIVKSAGGNDFYISAHEFVGSAFADTMIGSTGANAFYGGAGADVLVGGAKGTADTGDFLSGEGGTDKIKGGPGNDEIYGDTGADLINGGTGNDTIEGGGGDDVMYGSAGDDIVRGSKGSDQAWGGKGTFDVCAAEVTDSCEFTK